MAETLWITLPSNEENKLKEVIQSIKTENLMDLSLYQLLNYFDRKKDCEQGTVIDYCLYEEADKWQNILRNYSAIIEQGKPIIHLNTSVDEILSRLNSIRSQFRSHGKSELSDKLFKPNELMCLLIMCYTNPTLIGPNLCRSLKDNNRINIEKEMLENSAYNTQQNRVLPFSSNLRLLSTALYFNDTNIRLPVGVINRVVTETIRDGRIVIKLDQRGGFREEINGIERAENSTHRSKRETLKSEDTYAVLQSLQSSDAGIAEKDTVPYRLDLHPSAPQVSQSVNGEAEFTPEALALNSTENAASSSYGNGLVIGSLALFHVARNTPVVAVVRNIGKDLVTAGKHVRGFFSRSAECEEHQEQTTTLLSPTNKC